MPMQFILGTIPDGCTYKLPHSKVYSLLHFRLYNEYIHSFSIQHAM